MHPRLKNVAKKVLFRNRGEYVLDKEWDNLIILDACRYDAFVKVAGEYGIRHVNFTISRGSCTFEFLQENFSNRDCSDIVYVTANPYVSLLLKDKVYRIIPVWDFGWNEELKTVLPDVVYKEALKAKQKYSDKRLIVHFMQPHEPYIDLYKYNVPITGFEMARKEVEAGVMFRWMDKCIWEFVRKGVFDRKLAIAAYYNNLRLVFPYALKLAKILPGKSIITADHGEGFGERVALFARVWGHPPHVYTPILTKVPWYEVDGGSLKEVEKELIRGVGSAVRSCTHSRSCRA